LDGFEVKDEEEEVLAEVEGILRVVLKLKFES
jgi:hypothetical protein